MEREWGSGEQMERKWVNGERFTFHISSLSLYFLPLYPFPISNIARIANAVQVATFYSEDKIDKKYLSSGR